MVRQALQRRVLELFVKICARKVDLQERKGCRLVCELEVGLHALPSPLSADTLGTGHLVMAILVYKSILKRRATVTRTAAASICIGLREVGSVRCCFSCATVSALTVIQTATNSAWMAYVKPE